MFLPENGIVSSLGPTESSVGAGVYKNRPMAYLGISKNPTIGTQRRNILAHTQSSAARPLRSQIPLIIQCALELHSFREL